MALYTGQAPRAIALTTIPLFSGIAAAGWRTNRCRRNPRVNDVQLSATRALEEPTNPKSPRVSAPESNETSGWGRRVAAMGTIAAVGVAVIYIPQPIQTLVAAEFGVPVESSAAAAIAVQAGYAIGVVLLVSLGDRLAARTQVSFQLIATAAAILAAAFAPGYVFFTIVCFLAGATATVGQILVSAALRMAPPQARAGTAAVLLGSFIIGLFAVRTAVGSLAELFGWRAVLVGCAALLLACVPLSLFFAPGRAAGEPPSYLRILASIPRIAIGSPTLVLMTFIHVFAFDAFIDRKSVV